MNNELIFPTCLIGKTKEEAKSICCKHGYIFALSKEDDRNFLMTQDFNTNRIKIDIEKNNVTRAAIG